MATAYKSPYPKFQAFDANGDPLSGGKLYTYITGTTTPKTTYTDSTGTVTNTNPVILDSRGEANVWLDGAYTLVLKDSNDVQIWSVDNISGIGSISDVLSQWVLSGLTPTYVSATSFTLSGDQTTEFEINRRIKTTNSGGVVYSTISNSVYSAPNTTITTTNDDAASLDSGLSDVSLGIVSFIHSALPDLALTESDGEFRTVQVFTSSGTWNKSTGLARAKITVIGGGGGGGGSSATANRAGAGGGGGGTAIKYVEASSLGASETVTIGAAGAAGTSAGNGGQGGTSSFGALASATGGQGGDVGSTNSAGKLGGNGFGGAINIYGTPGGRGYILTTGLFTGGNSILGAGGQEGLGATSDSVGNPGRGYGGGGSGGTNITGAAQIGGAGSAGIVIVEEFY